MIKWPLGPHQLKIMLQSCVTKQPSNKGGSWFLHSVYFLKILQPRSLSQPLYSSLKLLMLTTGKKRLPASHQEARVGRLTAVKHRQRHFYSYLVNNHRFFSFFCSAASAATSDHAIKPVKTKKGFPRWVSPPNFQLRRRMLSLIPCFCKRCIPHSLHPYVNQKQPFLWFLWLWLSVLSHVPQIQNSLASFPLALPRHNLRLERFSRAHSNTDQMIKTLPYANTRDKPWLLFLLYTLLHSTTLPYFQPPPSWAYTLYECNPLYGLLYSHFWKQNVYSRNNFKRWLCWFSLILQTV